jgi:hypothetical protein
VAKKSTVDDDDIDEIDTFDDFEDVKDVDIILDDLGARRRLEKVLENKALERMIYGDFYDGDLDRDIYDYD